MKKYRKESDSFGEINVPIDKLWGAQTQRSLKYFNIGVELMPKEMIPAYAIVKLACAIVNKKHGLISEKNKRLIVTACNELLDGNHLDAFPLHVWMTGSGTQFNMNINEVIANRCSQIEKKPLGSKDPVHPNDDVNRSQSTNDTFPTAMHIATALSTHFRLLPTLQSLHESIEKKASQWKNIVKLGRTHLQDATPITLGQEFSGYAAMLQSDIENINLSLKKVYELTIGGTAVGTGLNAPKHFDKEVAEQIAKLTKLPFLPTKSKFADQGAHSALVQFSGTLKTLATSLYKIANDIRLLGSGPRAGLGELLLPENEPGSSIMPGKVNPTQCEALCMVATQVMASDFAITMGNAGGHLEMNASKPLIIYNLLQSIRNLSDSCENFEEFCIRGIKPNLKRIKANVEQSLMLVTALTPLIGYDKASAIAKYAHKHETTLRKAALKLGHITGKEFDKAIKPLDMCKS